MLVLLRKGVCSGVILSSLLLAAWAASAASDTSAKPTINCTKAQSSLARVICSGPDAADADWILNAASWALRFSMDPADREFFAEHEVDWLRSLYQRCRLPVRSSANISEKSRRCVIEAYRGRASAYRSKLKGDALAEAKLSPKERVQIQQALVSMGHLSGETEMDGEFGSNTRHGIRAFLAAGGLPESDFLSSEARDELLRKGREAFAARRGFSPNPRESGGGVSGSVFPTGPTDRAETDLPSSPGTARLDGSRTVQVTAIGETPEAARKEATRLAVQQVAGVFVDNRRRVEIQMSEQKVSEIVEEQILSYTNAYVTKLEVLSTAQEAGTYTVKAEVTVAVEPLLKTLQAYNVPTVAFDTESAAGTAESISEEKANAFAIYTDLLARIDGLIKVGVGKAEVAPSIPSDADSAWISVPVSFFFDDESLREWKKKFALISDRRARVLFPVARRRPLEASPYDDTCVFPDLSLSMFSLRGSHGELRNFLGERPVSGQLGVAACFLTATAPGGFVGDCFGRAFLVQQQRSGSCADHQTCFALEQSASSIQLALEFLDGNGDAVHALQAPFENFPAISRTTSRPAPKGVEAAFFNYCVGKQRVFFTASKIGRRGGMDIPFGDTIIFPPPGSRVDGLLNVLLPNETIGKIVAIRALITREAKPQLRGVQRDFSVH